MTYRNRQHFAAVVNRARREKTLTSYDKQRGQWRAATINWQWHIYEPAWSTMLDEERCKATTTGASMPTRETRERSGCNALQFCLS
jgi:hypothetical protein